MFDYYFFRRTIPVLFFVFYMGFNEENNEKFKMIYYSCILIIMILLLHLVIGMFWNIDFYERYKMSWNYASLIEWLFFALIVLIYTMKKTKDYLFSINVMVQCISCAGWIYEIPFFHNIDMFISKLNPLLINTQIMSIIFLMYLLRKKELEMNNKIFYSFTIYLLFSMHLYKTYPHWVSSVFPDYHKYIPSLAYHAKWFIRLPTILLLLSILAGINENDN